jgi:2-oxoglutarate ferredoxin oxidoreductase subunit alpha
LRHEITIAFVGSGGDGAVAAGDIIAAACAAEGLHVIKTEAYGPQIRGGESSTTIRISTKPIHAPADAVDILAVFNWADFARFREEIALAEDAVVLHEPGDVPPAGFEQRVFVPIPFNQLAKDATAPKSKNVVAAGAAVKLAGLSPGATRAAIASRFAKKATAVVEANFRPRRWVTGGNTSVARHFVRTLGASPDHVGERRLFPRHGRSGLPVLRRLPDHSFLRGPTQPQ